MLLGGRYGSNAVVQGLAANIAARLQQTAPPGSLRVSDSSYDTVRGLRDVQVQVQVQVQKLLAIKRLGAPIISYLVQRARLHAQRTVALGIAGVVPRMIGRAAELLVSQQATLGLQAGRRLGAGA